MELTDKEVEHYQDKARNLEITLNLMKKDVWQVRFYKNMFAEDDDISNDNGFSIENDNELLMLVHMDGITNMDNYFSNSLNADTFLIIGTFLKKLECNEL